MRTTRIGLMGFGSGGRVFHAPLIASAPGVQFAGVVTTSAERRLEVASLHPGLPVFADLAELAAAGADAVTISTPVRTHLQLVHEAISLGLAVVCDKPFALDAGSARAAVRAAQAAGVVLSVYQNRRWDADFLTVRRLLLEGELGTVHRFESRFERFRPGSPPPASGGGVLRDLGSHLFDQALQLFGPVSTVYAEADLGARDEDEVIDEGFFAALQHESGVVSHLTGDWVQGAPGPRFRVTGSVGSFVLAKPMEGQEPMLKAGRTPATEGDAWGVEPGEDWGRIEHGGSSTVVASERGRWDVFYPAFAAAVRGEGEVPVDPWDAVATLEMMDAARASARSRRSVPLGAFSR